MFSLRSFLLRRLSEETEDGDDLRRRRRLESASTMMTGGTGVTPLEALALRFAYRFEAERDRPI